jgi:HK97 family phage prohead protease
MYPTDNLVRSVLVDDAVQLRDNGAAPAGRTLTGHFALFNEWAEIHSRLEGHFLERIAPGAFARAFAEQRDRVKVLYDHGRDPQLGNKPLGRILDLTEDERGAAFEIDLIRTSYNDDFIIPAAEAGVLGASFRFSIPDGGDSWNMKPRPSNRNPEGLPERTIHDLDLFEFGPVTFPAYEATDVGVRCGTDAFVESLRSDPKFLARFVERCGPNVVERVLDSLPPTAQEEPSRDELPATPQIEDQEPPVSEPPAERSEEPDETPEGSVDDQPPKPSTAAERRKMARLIEAERLGVGKEH